MQRVRKLIGLAVLAATTVTGAAEIGREVAIDRHLQDGEEFGLPLTRLIEHGKRLFAANWTSQEGAGRPLSKGTGAPLADPNAPLLAHRGANRISGPDANSCAGCHDAPFGAAGGGGDRVANVFVLAQRFDFATFDRTDTTPSRGAADERHAAVTLQSIGNSRASLGMYGSGYIEMLARQISAELQAIRNRVAPGSTAKLMSKGISFGVIARAADGTWDTSRIEGIAAPSLVSAGRNDPPSLIIRPFHQAGNVISLRQFTNNAFNHHHGIQPAERFGVDADADGDGFANELTRADVTAVTLFQATLAVPGRVIPDDPEVENAVALGENRFAAIGCAQCHIPSLPLDRKGWVFTEPNPQNPAGNLRPEDAPTFSVDLSADNLPGPRLKPRRGVVQVPAFTDFKLHDITRGPEDPDREPLDMNQPVGSSEFFAGNGKFITRKLWGTANEPPYFHHGRFTTLREAVLAHHGEARDSRQAFESLPRVEQDSIIEFLKTLQVLPPGTRSLVVNEHGKRKRWPPRDAHGIPHSDDEAEELTTVEPPRR